MSRDIKGFLKPDPTGGFLVGAEDKESHYRGPVARVSIDNDWLNIITDDYEGHAMLNVEALPFLRRALAKLEAARNIVRKQ